ncbi:hypothetical protein B0H17DRAFT_1215531 [Mycena rosella]|uniref:Uncharacterized protein n=1 Tax=Mycena rosella TaxID=1033263 RepID=A0AAD7CHF1_MYCRO|nr:hypothetical protein B0H17DRAFT_1215531 [Mycena rosella]
MFRLIALAGLALLQAVSAGRYPSYGTLQTTNSSGVLNVSDLANLIETLQANDTDIRVVVFSSAKF